MDFSLLSGGSVPLLVGLTVSPSPSPTSTPTVEPTPAPTVTVTVTETAAPSGPSTVILDGDQFGGLTTGIVLLVFLLAALLISQMKRP